MILTLETINEILDEFARRENPRENEKKKANKCIEELKNLIRMRHAVEKDIHGPKKNEAERTKENIVKFEEELKLYQHDLKKEAYFSYGTGFDKAM